MSRPLFDAFPALIDRVPWAPLADLPTAVESLGPVLRAAGTSGAAWIKRDDQTSSIYGGNKVRTLEPLFGEARALEVSRVYATGAYGSNHAAATVLHAPRVGLSPGAVLFPQPYSEAARANLVMLLEQPADLVDVMHWSALPVGMLRARLRRRQDEGRPYLMVPGGATPRGALGYVSAAFEVARQIEQGELPAPSRIVLAVGSTCTSAGLLAGTHLAAMRRMGFVDRQGDPDPPSIHSVRVTPWPITSAWRIARLASRTLRFLSGVLGEPHLACSAGELKRRLVVDGNHLGRGYGHPTSSGRTAIEAFRSGAGLVLDTTYSAKAAAAVLALTRDDFRGASSGPLLFWSTKSSASLPSPGVTTSKVPRRMARWLVGR